MTQIWNEPERARTMGAAGREYARREYSKEAYCARLLEVYRSLCAAT
jgi:glycosyltransferase involved in cell wall biosynthesis